MLGAASMIVGIGAAILVAYGIALHISEDRITTQSLVYQLTHPSVVVSALTIAAPAAVSGGLALAIARRTRSCGRASLGGSDGRPVLGRRARVRRPDRHGRRIRGGLPMADVGIDLFDPPLKGLRRWLTAEACGPPRHRG